VVAKVALCHVMVVSACPGPQAALVGPLSTDAKEFKEKFYLKEVVKVQQEIGSKSIFIFC
jgi:hypothetical protein